MADGKWIKVGGKSVWVKRPPDPMVAHVVRRKPKRKKNAPEQEKTKPVKVDFITNE